MERSLAFLRHKNLIALFISIEILSGSSMAGLGGVDGQSPSLRMKWKISIDRNGEYESVLK